MNTDVTVILLSYKRIPNMEKVITSWQKSTIKPKEIFLINNNPNLHLRFDGITVINCGRNLGCTVRHSFGLMAETDCCIFADDDFQPEPEIISNFVKWHGKYPEAILGYFGMKLNKDSYSKGTRIHGKDLKEAMETDICLGRIHFCKTSKLAQSFTILNETQDYPNKEDDILLSLANKYYGNKNYIIPIIKNASYVNLPELDIGLGHRKNHLIIRDRAAKALLKSEVQKISRK